MRHYLLDFIKRRAQNQQYFSNTTYSILYKLINTKKIGVFFVPSLRIKKFLSTDKSVDVVGGYDFKIKRIELYIKWSFGADTFTTEFIKPQLNKVCRKMFAVLLSEGLLLYDYKTNGELSKHEMVQKWYYTYFRDVIGDSVQKWQLATNIAEEMSKDYGPRLYDAIEKPMIEQREPDVIVKMKGDNPDLDIEGIPSIEKGDKKLEDIFKDAIEDFAVKQRDNYNVDNFTFKNIKAFSDEFGEFGKFLYKNRDLNLNIKAISAQTSNDIVSNELSDALPMVKESEASERRKIRQEEADERDRSYKAYLEKYPELQKKLNSPIRQSLKAGFKRSQELRNQIPAQVQPDNRLVAEAGKSYVARIMEQDVAPSIQQYEDIITGLRKMYTDNNALYDKIIDMQNNNQSNTDIFNDLVNDYYKRQTHFNSTLIDAWRLFSMNTEGTKNENLFSSPNPDIARNQSVPDKSSKALAIIDNMDHVVEEEKKNIAMRKQNRKNSDNKLLNKIKLSDQARRELAGYERRLTELNQWSKEAITDSQRDNFMRERLMIAQKITDIANRCDNNIQKILKIPSDDQEDIRATANQATNPNLQKFRDIISNKIGGGNTTIYSFITYLEQNRVERIKNVLDGSKLNEIDTSNINQKIHDFLEASRYCQLLLHANSHLPSDNQQANSLKNELGASNNSSVNIPLFNDQIVNKIKNVFKVKKINVNGQSIDFDGTENSFNNIVSLIASNNNHNIANDQDKVNALKTLLYNPTVTRDMDGAFRVASNYIIDYSRECLKALNMDRYLSGSGKGKKIENPTKIRQLIRAIRDPNTADTLRQKYNLTPNDIQILQRKLLSLPDIKNKSTLTDEELAKFKEVAHDLIDFNNLALDNGNRSLIAFDDKDRYLTRSSIDKYRHQLWIDGVDYVFDKGVPTIWKVIKELPSLGIKYAKSTFKALKVAYKFGKLLLPLKSNFDKIINTPMGFNILGNIKMFDNAYKINFGIKDMYKDSKGSCKKNFIYNEIYMPVAIHQKILFAQLDTQNEFDANTLYLIDCANKGLEMML